MLILFIMILVSLVGSSDETVYSCNASASCGCSTYSAVLSRIVGGETASSATWSWAVSLSIADTYLCGGSIISKSWVITAAHCVSGQSASQIKVYAGSSRRWTGSQNRLVSKIIVHSDYDTGGTYANDIALLKLSSPLTMADPYVSSICLPSVSATTLSAGEWPAVATTVVAVGWGRLSETGSASLTIQQVTLQTVSYQASSCSSLIKDRRVQFCAGVSGGGKDTCQGDSGGPLMMFSSSSQWMLVGLTSYGDGCAQAGKSGVYTRVAAFQDWINSTMSYANERTESNIKLLLFVLPLVFTTLV